MWTRLTNAISCFEPDLQEPYREIFETHCMEQGVSKNVHVRHLGTRFTNAVSCFELGPQELYRDFSETTGLFSSKHEREVEL
jgi:hypothetical protein